MKVGDKVKVTKEINGHQFQIGEKLTLIEELSDPGSWRCQGKDDWWALTEDEFELLNQ